MTQTLSRAEIEEWRQEFRNDPIMNPEALAELETLCTMALSHADAYERGQRDMAAAAVKEIEPIGPTPSCCEECARRWHVLREKADALRALSPGEWGAVPDVQCVAWKENITTELSVWIAATPERDVMEQADTFEAAKARLEIALALDADAAKGGPNPVVKTWTVPRALIAAAQE